MRRWGLIAGCGFVLLAFAGCATIRSRGDRDVPSAAQSALVQQLSQTAQAAIDRHDYNQARADLERLVAESPRSAEAHHRLGRVFHVQNQFDEAKRAYRKALEIDSEYVGALIGLGEIEDRLGQAEPALKRLESAIELDPQKAEAHFARGRILEAAGRSDEALAAYFRTLELDPSSAPVILRIATLQLGRREPEQALTRLDQVLELTPGNPEAHFQRGQAHLVLNQPALAVADLRIASQNLPNRPDVFYQLALALNADHKAGEALNAAQHALALAPNDPEARSLTERLRR
ncbi:tetratricopeptide repeat protein [Singulisphaera sp. Ch08]|uniref:Tetratricopeptide repeat protein n=1 Tax=Singulisphaera sp. Ch08 TaxID=3120278 RepID=A0AAU7CL86_9BACT